MENALYHGQGSTGTWTGHTRHHRRHLRRQFVLSTADTEDVLSFHNYLPTRGAIAADIAKAKAYAVKVNKTADQHRGRLHRARQSL